MFCDHSRVFIFSCNIFYNFTPHTVIQLTVCVGPGINVRGAKSPSLSPLDRVGRRGRYFRHTVFASFVCLLLCVVRTVGRLCLVNYCMLSSQCFFWRPRLLWPSRGPPGALQERFLYKVTLHKKRQIYRFDNVRMVDEGLTMCGWLMKV